MKPLSDRIFASCSVDSDIKVIMRNKKGFLQVLRLGVLQVWDLGNKKAPLLHTLDEHLGYVTCIEWIPGGVLVRGPKSLNFLDGNFQRAKTFRTKCVNRFRDNKSV